MAEKGKYQLRETKLVYEWVKEFHPNALQWRRVRIGPFPPGHDEKIFGVVRRWADLVFLENDTVHIVEAKMRPDPGALSQLELYKKLFPQTPEFRSLRRKKIKLIFLTTMDEPTVKALAKEKGIEYVVFAPDWVKEYLATLYS